MKIIKKLLPVLAVSTLLVSCGGGSSSSDGSGDHVLPPTSTSNIDTVLRTGDVINTPITEVELLQAAQDEIESLKAGEPLLKALYKNEPIAYDASNRSQLININGDAHKIFPILQGNKGKTLAVAGIKENSRFAAFGAAPMEHFQARNNLSYESQFKRLLGWLITANADDVLSVSKTIGLSFTYSDKTNIKAWISSNYPSWVIQECDRNSPDFATCYNNVDLIITGWQTDEENTQLVRERLEEEVNRGTPILYLHTWYEAYNGVAHTIAKLFDFSLPYGGNYWAKDKASWNNIEAMQTAYVTDLGYNSIATMVSHFQAKDYHFDWAECTEGKGVFGSQYDGCASVTGLSSGFQAGATKVREMMTGLDSAKTKIFTGDDYRLQKLLALIGDKFRQTVAYPMDKVTTDDHTFMRSFYADHAVYNYRNINPAQQDMGNFSRSDFSHITPITKIVNLTSKKSFRSAGVYALPGQTVKVTRNDNSDLTVKVFINTLRSGATHQYEANHYNRPKYLQTPHFEIKSGETIKLTSPYGGPLQLEFSTNDLPVEVYFENIGEHAYWASSADNNSFAQKLNANEYDWAEVATAGFEVHSKLDKMIASVEDEKWGGTAEGLANAVEKYTSNYPHVLAGFKGNGVDVVPEIHDWANNKGLTIETIDKMKHMNADQAACGYGCSGNPYDAYWSFDPIGHGDIHEMGHSLQKMRFEGFPNHAATNTFSYYTKSRYTANTGDADNGCWGMPFKTMYETIQSSVGKADVEVYLKTNLWDKAGLGEQYLLTIQAMMHAQKMGKVDNGWHILARVHILEREMSRAKQDWDAKKASVGFDRYTLDEINAIRNNDWLIVAYSYAAGLDYTSYFDMMGIPYSQKARDQITSFGFEVVPNALFKSEDTAYCSSANLMDQPLISVDGTTVWVD